MSILAMMTGFGLAAAAGGRACLVLVALGLFHYTDYFELSAAYLWVANPVVICVSSVLALAEIVADAHPEISELVDLASYLPKFVVGFIALSASTGAIDDNLLRLVASGVVGGGTASAVHFVRAQLRELVHTTAGHAGDHVNSGYSWMESGGVLAMAGMSVFSPIIAVLVALVAGVVGTIAVVFLRRKMQAWTAPPASPVVATPASPPPGASS